MAKPATRVLNTEDQTLEWVRQIAIVVGASLFVALCAKITLPLPFTPIPLTLQNFGVLFVGLMLGSRRGFAAMVLYLAEGASGMPVFSPVGPGGVAQLFGLTGGYLLAYPFVAFLAGWIMERGKATFLRAVTAGLLAEIVLFAGGIGWLAILTHSFQQAVRFGLYWFLFGEVIKIFLAAGACSGGRRVFRTQTESTQI